MNTMSTNARLPFHRSRATAYAASSATSSASSTAPPATSRLLRQKEKNPRAATAVPKCSKVIEDGQERRCRGLDVPRRFERGEHHPVHGEHRRPRTPPVPRPSATRARSCLLLLPVELAEVGQQREHEQQHHQHRHRGAEVVALQRLRDLEGVDRQRRRRLPGTALADHPDLHERLADPDHLKAGDRPNMARSMGKVMVENTATRPRRRSARPRTARAGRWSSPRTASQRGERHRLPHDQPDEDPERRRAVGEPGVVAVLLEPQRHQRPVHHAEPGLEEPLEHRGRGDDRGGPGEHEPADHQQPQPPAQPHQQQRHQRGQHHDQHDVDRGEPQRPP